MYFKNLTSRRNLLTTSITCSLLFFSAAAHAEVKRIWLTHQSPNPSLIVVNWESSEAGDSLVEYGPSADLGKSATQAGQRTLHHVEIPMAATDGVTHYRVKSGSQVSAISTFKGYPSKELRIGVVANLRADSKIDLSALQKEDIHLLLSSGDTAMQFQFCGENLPECTESHGTAIDVHAELFRSTPFLATLGNLDRKIRPKSDGAKLPAYEIEASAYRKFFALPGKEWIWSFDIPDFDLRLISLDMSHTRDFGTPDQACHPFGKDSEQLKWYKNTINNTTAGHVITIFGETGGTVRAHADGEWGRLIKQGSLAISGECYHAERVAVDGITYYNSSVRGNGTFGIDPNPAFLDKSASYLLLTLNKETGKMTAALKTLDGKLLEKQTFEKRSRKD